MSLFRVISYCDHTVEAFEKKWSLIRLFAYEKSSCKQRKYNNGGWSHELLAKVLRIFHILIDGTEAGECSNFLVTFTFVKIFLQLTRSIKD